MITGIQDTTTDTKIKKTDKLSAIMTKWQARIKILKLQNIVYLRLFRNKTTNHSLHVLI